MRGATGLAAEESAQTNAQTGGSIAPAGFALCILAAVGVATRRRVAREAAKKVKEDVLKVALANKPPRPEDLLESPKFPIYMGSAGGYMSRSTKERHAITWTSKEEQLFEMPTGGFAIMRKGENLCYFRRKEQCIALGKQLRTFKIENYKIYRQTKDGEVIFMHPADGVFPEKVNKGRVQVNGRPFNIGENPQPGLLKWTKYHMKPYEADPLTTYFVKARMLAFKDTWNIDTPPPATFIRKEDYDEYAKMVGDLQMEQLREMMPGKSDDDIKTELKQMREVQMKAQEMRAAAGLPQSL